ncbi:zinc-dependent metalloprotease [Chitinophagaceae bacterium MMS25-I14]
MKHILIIICLLCFVTQVKAQTAIADRIAGMPFEQFQSVDIFREKSITDDQDARYKKAVKSFSLMDADRKALERIVSGSMAALEISIPFEGAAATLQLVKNNVVDDQTIFTVQNGDRTEITDAVSGAYYYGVIKDQPHTLVALSFFNGNILGFISNDKGNYILGKSDIFDVTGDEYILYNDKDLINKAYGVCGNSDKDAHLPVMPAVALKGTATNKCIRVYVEADYEMYKNQMGQNMTSAQAIQNTMAFVTSMFNTISTIYANEQLTVSLKQVKVWSAADPYAGATDLNTALGIFQNAMANGFDGDLALLLVARDMSGGLASSIGGLCDDLTQRTAVCSWMVSYIPTAPVFNNYSWSIFEATHEMGHLLGSYHTHACVWNGNNTAIDGCGPTYGATFPQPVTYEGSCSGAPIPSNGGTIMSYCHLGAAGVNFNNGFGQQPGDVIRNVVASATCLHDCKYSCPANVYITGSYITPLQESQSFIESQGQTTISPTSSVKLDANPNNGYVGLYVTNSTDFFLADPSNDDAVFIAQALDGCAPLTPQRHAAPGETSSGTVLHSCTVYPNPAANEVTVSSAKSLENAKILLLDISGKAQRISVENISANSKKVSWENLSSGVYIIQIITDAKTDFAKLTIN